jgi:hypothetical protein
VELLEIKDEAGLRLQRQQLGTAMFADEVLERRTGTPRTGPTAGVDRPRQRLIRVSLDRERRTSPSKAQDRVL